MDLDKPVHIKELAALCEATIIGDADLEITGLNEIHKVRPGDLMFVDHPKYYAKSLQSAATAILINQRIPAPDGKVLLYHEEPFKAYDFLSRYFRPFQAIHEPISPLSKIEPGCIIEPGVIIGPHVHIGANTHIQANSYIGAYTIIGENVVIQPHVVIGSDAFYFNKKEGAYTTWKSLGRVIIEDKVEIGAASTIARGVSGDTIIGYGSKLDCQVHLGHGVVLGKHTLIAAQTGIGGKTIIGDHVTIYGQVGIAQNIKIGDRVVILGQTGVTKDLASDQTYFGTPVQEAREYYKQLISMRTFASNSKLNS